MADQTKIEWTDATWNTLRGCTRVSEGCRNCYAEAMAGRFSDPGQWGHGIATREPESAERYVLRGRWTGKVVLDEDALLKPLRWKKPRRIFVTSVSDPFHPSVTDEMLDRLFSVMAATPQHTYQLLTKRPGRMQEYLGCYVAPGLLYKQFVARDGQMPVNGRPSHAPLLRSDRWPLPNLWLGVSVENQATADGRIPHLLSTPAAVRFISAEPLLGPVNLRAITMEDTRFDAMRGLQHDPYHGEPVTIPRIDWVIVGGESGPKARPMHPDWARSLRDQCSAAGVPFMFKQWGTWAPYDEDCCRSTADIDPMDADEYGIWLRPDGGCANYGTRSNPAAQMLRMRGGKKAAGRLLDGREHLDIPEGR